MTSHTLRVGGVPEHFNYPWHLALESGDFLAQQIDLKWQDYSTGTGAMVRDLADDKLDLAVLLSEGAVAAISQGEELRILGWTVSTPLVWGVHVAPSNPAASLQDLVDPRIAISRFGSGSHLMAFVLMQQQGLSQAWRKHQFVVVNNLPGAADAFAANQADLFMWEQFTTQPSVDAGQMRRLTTCPTPWPPFCLVARSSLLASSPQWVRRVKQVYYKAANRADELPDLIDQIAQFYKLKADQVCQWRDITRWALNDEIAPSQVTDIIDQLAALDLVRTDLQAEDCMAIQ